MVNIWQGCGKVPNTKPYVYLLHKNGRVEKYRTSIPMASWLCGDHRDRDAYAPMCQDCLVKLGYIW